MSKTYCGKSCTECTFKEELSCLGCQAGPGKRHYGDCSLARCCIDKGHETCETCQIQPHCGVYRGRFYAPEKRLKDREAARAEQQRMAKRAPILGKWLWLLFWLVIPSTVGSLMTNEAVVAALPALYTPGVILNAVVVLLSGIILLRLGKLEAHYQTAAICMLLGGGVSILLDLLTGGKNETWMLLITVPMAVVGFVGDYNEFTAHSDALWGVDSELAYKWLALWKWHIGCYLGVFGAPLLTAIAPVLGVMVLLAGLIGIVVVNILQMVYLYNTAKQFRLYAALPIEE